ncbi:MAG TPA: hypothetical protein VFI06_13370, partial [Chitinophagaceae bacterium]|nr:hypothetical protein [Chitinophagaceae bacterium]
DSTHHSPLTINGAINIIDLANIYSCSFIATDDAGRLHHDGSFEVMGRIDNSDIRGCSLMYDPDPDSYRNYRDEN